MTNAVQIVMDRGHQFEYKELPIKALKVDEYYQRFVRQTKIDKIIANWDYDLVNPPKVSLRENGCYYIFDGQHTVIAYRTHEGDDAVILCKVYRGLTRHEEVELFLSQNGVVTPVTTAEKLRAMYNDNDIQVRSMVRDCSLCGVNVEFASPGRGNHTPGKCRCLAVSTLYDAYTKMPRNLFMRMMDTIVRTWNGDSNSLTAGFIGGMMEVYMGYGDVFTDSDMSKSLGKFAPSYYIREAKELTGRMKNRYRAIFLRVYNKNRTTKRIAVEAPLNGGSL